MRTQWTVVAACVAGAFATCGHGGGSCGGGDHHDEEEQFICDGDEDPFTAGTEAAGSQLTLRIVEARPGEHTLQGLPDEEGESSGLNELTLAVLDAGGDAVEGATFDKIEPFTAKHNHGTPVEAAYSELDGGEYDLTSITYVHRGPWHLNLDVSAGDVTDSMQFTFCIRDLAYEGDAGVGP